MNAGRKSAVAAVVGAMLLVAAVGSAESTAPGTRYVIGVSGMH